MQLKKYNKLRNRNAKSKLPPNFDKAGVNQGGIGAPHIAKPDVVPSQELPIRKTPRKAPPVMTPRESLVLNAARGARTFNPQTKTYTYLYPGASTGHLPTIHEYNRLITEGKLEGDKLTKPLGQNW